MGEVLQGLTPRPASSCLLYFPYRGDDEVTGELAYGSASFAGDRASSNDSTVLDLSNEANLKQYICHSFPAGSIWTPQRLEVNGRKGRRAVCVIAEDSLHYRIFDLDSSREVDEAEGQEIGENDSSDMNT